MTGEPGFAQAAANLSQSLARLMETVAGFARTRLDLLGGSMETERRRRMWLAFGTCALVLLLSFGTLFAGFAVVAAFWDTYRVLAAAAVAAGFFVLAGAVGWTLWAKRRRHPSALDWIAQLVALFAEYRRLMR